MNTLPRKKIHENDAAKSAAYQARLREERAALKAFAALVIEELPQKSKPVVQLMEKLPKSQREAIERAVRRSQNTVTNLSELAA